MHFHIISIFPDTVDSYLNESILKHAQENKLIFIHKYALREYTKDKHRRVDGKPYAGGPGMVMWVDPIINCVEKVKENIEKRIEKENKKIEKLLLKYKNLSTEERKKFLIKNNLDKKTFNLKNKVTKAKIKYILFTPEKIEFTNTVAKQVVESYTDTVFICGRYEGVDARVKQILEADEWSIGPYVLTGGELPAMVCIDAMSRQIKGVLNHEESLEESRVSSHDVYARPEVYEYKIKNKQKTKIVKYEVPKVLLSGNHKEIEKWKLQTKENI
jgi:tRNA (guanine37-N1)-methyltransferase